MRFWVVAGLVLAAASGAAPALAQNVQSAPSAWTFEGVTFAPREGWCSKVAMQPVPGGDPVQALEVRPCGADFPYLSVGIGKRQAGDLNVVDLLNRAAQSMEGATGKNNILTTFQNSYGTCTLATYDVNRKPLPGLGAVTVTSSANCSKDTSGPIWYRNLATFVMRPNGDLWAVAFDYPSAPMTDGDILMIRSAVATIATN